MNTHDIKTTEQTAHILASHGQMLEALRRALPALSLAIGMGGHYCERGGMEVTLAKQAWIEVQAAIQAAEAGGM